MGKSQAGIGCHRHRLGVSARAMLKALVNGTDSPEALAAHAKGRLRSNQSALTEALTGQVREHHRFLIQTHLEHLEFQGSAPETV